MSSYIDQLGNLSLASIKNTLDEVRVQVYPRNETERKVRKSIAVQILQQSKLLVAQHFK